jgi:hypothetical protein
MGTKGKRWNTRGITRFQGQLGSNRDREGSTIDREMDCLVWVCGCCEWEREVRRGGILGVGVGCGKGGRRLEVEVWECGMGLLLG